MFESRLIEEILMEDFSPTSSDKTRRDATHILENILDWCPEDEEDSAFMQFFLALASIDRIDGLITLCYEHLLTLYSHLSRKTIKMSWHNIMGFRSLQRFLKHVQEQGRYEIGKTSTIPQLTKITFIASSEILSNIWVMQEILDLISHLLLPGNC